MYNFINSDEANFLYSQCEVDQKFRCMFKHLFKQYGIGNRALHLYLMLARNGLKAEELSTAVSGEQEPDDKA